MKIRLWKPTCPLGKDRVVLESDFMRNGVRGVHRGRNIAIFFDSFELEQKIHLERFRDLSHWRSGNYRREAIYLFFLEQLEDSLVWVKRE